MVCFQCDICVETLKKKQVETHYQFRCRNAYTFSCLTCWQIFDRNTIKDHIACVSEDQKYKSTDKKFKIEANSGPNKSNTNGTGNGNGNKLNGNKNDFSKIKTKIDENLINEDVEGLSWSGFKKTSLKLFSKLNIKELKTTELVRYLMKIYINTKNDGTIEPEDFKKILSRKLKEDSRFIIKN